MKYATTKRIKNWIINHPIRYAKKRASTRPTIHALMLKETGLPEKGM